MMFLLCLQSKDSLLYITNADSQLLESDRSIIKIELVEFEWSIYIFFNILNKHKDIKLIISNALLK